MKGFGIVLRNVNTPNISVQSRTIEPSKMFSRSKNNDLISDRIYRINKIKATLFHPDYPVNPVRNYFNSNSTVAIHSPLPQPACLLPCIAHATALRYIFLPADS